MIRIFNNTSQFYISKSNIPSSCVFANSFSNTFRLNVSDTLLNLVKDYFFEESGMYKNTYGWSLVTLYENLYSIPSSDVEYIFYYSFLNYCDQKSYSRNISNIPQNKKAFLLPPDRVIPGNFMITKVFLLALSEYLNIVPCFLDIIDMPISTTTLNFSEDFQLFKRLGKQKDIEKLKTIENIFINMLTNCKNYYDDLYKIKGYLLSPCLGFSKIKDKDLIDYICDAKILLYTDIFNFVHSLIYYIKTAKILNTFKNSCKMTLDDQLLETADKILTCYLRYDSCYITTVYFLYKELCNDISKKNNLKCLKKNLTYSCETKYNRLYHCLLYSDASCYCSRWAYNRFDMLSYSDNDNDCVDCYCSTESDDDAEDDAEIAHKFIAEFNTLIEGECDDFY